MATSLWVQGVDTEAEFGFSLSDEGDVLGGAVVIPGEIEIPYAVGSFYAGAPRVPAREFTLVGQMTAADFDTNRDNLTRFKGLMGTGVVTLRLRGALDVMIEAKLVKVSPANLIPQHVTPWVRVEATFRAAFPYWRDLYALPRWFGSTPTVMPQGTGDVAPELWLFGGTNPVVTGYDYRGNPLWTSTFTITLGANDALRVVTGMQDMSIWKYLASMTGTNDDTLLSAGIFPKSFFATSTSYLLGQFPALSVSSGWGMAVYPRMWR